MRLQRFAATLLVATASLWVGCKRHEPEVRDQRAALVREDGADPGARPDLLHLREATQPVEERPADRAAQGQRASGTNGQELAARNKAATNAAGVGTNGQGLAPAGTNGQELAARNNAPTNAAGVGTNGQGVAPAGTNGQGVAPAGAAGAGSNESSGQGTAAGASSPSPIGANTPNGAAGAGANESSGQGTAVAGAPSPSAIQGTTAGASNPGTIGANPPNGAPGAGSTDSSGAGTTAAGTNTNGTAGANPPNAAAGAGSTDSSGAGTAGANPPNGAAGAGSTDSSGAGTTSGGTNTNGTTDVSSGQNVAIGTPGVDVNGTNTGIGSGWGNGSAAPAPTTTPAPNPSTAATPPATTAPGAASATVSQGQAFNPFGLPQSVADATRSAQNGTLGRSDHALPGGGGNSTIVSSILGARGASTMQGVATATYDSSGNAFLVVDVNGAMNGTYAIRMAEGTSCLNGANAAPEVYTGQVIAPGLNGPTAVGSGGLSATLEDATASTIGQLSADQDGHGHFETAITGLGWRNEPPIVTRKILVQEIPGATNPQLGDSHGYVSCGVISLVNPLAPSG